MANLSNWGRWGREDEIGTANFVTADKIVEACRLVRKGRVLSLAIPLNPRTPTDSSRPPMQHFARSVRLKVADHGWGGDSEFADDWISMSPQTGTQWDGLTHAFREGKVYNGYDAGQALNPVIGARKCSIDRLATYFVTRGVLLDLVGYKGYAGEGHLPGGKAVTAGDLEGCAQQQRVEIRRGDALMVRTGWVPLWYRAAPKERESYYDVAPGLGMSTAEWLHRKEVACLGVDNVAVEVKPAEDGKSLNPLHPVLIRDLGLTIGELFWFEDLTRACAAEGSWEFLFVAQPLRITGGIGSPINPLAIR
ncbi:MAG: cyclase family protein [Candidatus Rokubacteria bacterium]|nr:cyclase family protein [Candidatus Rokubacteria bacterium]